MRGDETDFHPGRMQDWPLTIDRIARHAETVYPDVTIASRSAAGAIERVGYAAMAAEARCISRSLSALGIKAGDRVATMAWNTARHMSLWYGISAIGAVAHPLNPRFSIDQLAWIVAHAGDRLLFLDAGLAPIVAQLRRRTSAIGRPILMDAARADALLDGMAFEEFLAAGENEAAARWGGFDEHQACALFYTSGTTGSPKGVLYSHRSNVLHALMVGQLYRLAEDDVVMPVVPMFHANCWGFVHLCPMLGSALVLPGSKLDPASLQALIEGEGVTFAAGVPTIWMALLEFLTSNKLRVPSLRRVLAGGAAVPPVLIERFRDEHGVTVLPVWGMTETSPAGTIGGIVPDALSDPHERSRAAARQGRGPFGFDMKVVDHDGADAPNDGRTAGRLLVRGPAVVARYFGEDRPAIDEDGWFDTGDIAVIHPDAAMEITDRAKDLIKSGGEWISSAAIEEAAHAHPAVGLCAAIAVPDAKWTERPLLVVCLRQGASADPESIRQVLSDRLERWWLPDRIEFIADMPLGATGKVDKKALRERFRALLAAQRF